MAAPVLQFKRGLSTNVGLASFRAGEPGFTTDKYDFYIGLDGTAANQKFFGSARYWTKETGSAAAILKLVDKNGSNSTNLKAADTLAGIVTFTLPSADGTANQALVTNGSGTLSFASVTTSAGTLTGAGAGITAFLVTPSSANLATAVTDETGSGSLVFANTPTLVTPVLGTPTSGTLTNCTGLPVSTGISGLGANVATFLATPSSANLASALTDETGSSSVVFSSSPTFTGTAAFASATATSVVVGSAVTITASGLTAGASGIITASSFRPASGYYQSADGTNAFFVYNTSGNVAFQGTIGASQLNSAGGNKVIGLLGTVASFDGNVNISGISSFANVTANNINATGIVTATTFSGGLAVSNITGLGANVSTFLATPSSANLASAVTDETGSGALVFANTPTLVTPVLGTPTSGTLTNCTGLPISTGVSGLAANVATFLATPSSANLAAALTDETGSGANVFANSPTLVTPVLGAATATSIVVGSATTITASGLTAGAAGIVTAATVNTTNVKALDGTTAITITNSTGAVATNSDLTVGGNLYVNGSTTQVNTSQMTVEDRTIELGIVDGAAPSSTTTWDLGVLFNYHDGAAKKSALVWEQADARFKLGSVISDGGGTGVNNPQITFTSYAALELGELWVNASCTGSASTRVVGCTGGSLILENITIDAGSF
jgi:hypothetical protein